jgi:hypothetical protein
VIEEVDFIEKRRNAKIDDKKNVKFNNKAKECEAEKERGKS